MSGVRRSLALLGVSACLLAAGCTGRAGTGNDGSATTQNGVTSGTGTVYPVGGRVQAPALSGATLDGTDLNIADLRGKVVVLNFWASWCGPCRGEADNLQKVYAQTAASGVAFVGIDIKDEQSAAKALERNFHITYPSIFDQSSRLLLKFRGQAPQEPPATIVLDRQGRVAARFTGPVTEAELVGPVQSLASEPA